MLLQEVEYRVRSTLEDALRLLASNDGGALAGGQTLINVMKQRAASPDVLVDLNRLGELRKSDAAMPAGSCSARWRPTRS